jgi:L-asparagine transporter-like permease
MIENTKKLKARHIQMIALGGSIGTGLFFGLGKSIQFTGASVIFAYLLGGIIMYIIMRALGELVVYEPNVGAFSYYAGKYVSKYLGFVAGWFAWFEYTIVCMQDLTASSIFMDHWVRVPHWITISIFLALFVLVNMVNVKIFGEFEFYFAGIKIAAILMMLGLFIFLFLFNVVMHNSIIHNLYALNNNIFTHGATGFLSALTLVLFAFGGTQFIGIAAAECDDPARQVPKAIRGVVFRILFFYILSIVILFGFYPIYKIANHNNVFVTVLQAIGLTNCGEIMNFVIIITVLSAVNSCFYAASRMLYSLAKQGHAPKIFAVNNAEGVPKTAVLFNCAVVACTVLLNYLLPQSIIYYLLSFTIVSIIVTWSTILICHFYFRKKHLVQDYKLPFFPYTSLFAMLGLITILIAMLQISYMKIAVYMLPISLIVITVLYWFYKEKYE